MYRPLDFASAIKTVFYTAVDFLDVITRETYYILHIMNSIPYTNRIQIDKKPLTLCEDKGII